MKKYFEKLGVKVLKTMAQTAVGIIGTSYVLSDVNWQTVISASLLSGLVAILMNLSDLKEGE